jgi:hypothetical protein
MAEVVLTGDSDLLGCGHQKVVIVRSYHHEIHRIVDLSDIGLAILLSHPDTTDNARKMVDACSRIGPCIFHCHAACNGCDFSRDMSGVSGIGEKSFFQIISTLLKDTEDGFSLEEFAAAVATSGKVNQSWQGDIEKEVLEISHCYLGAKCYDKERNVRSLDQCGFAEATDFTKRHAAGLVNPRTRADFSNKESVVLSALRPSDLSHDSSKNTSNISGCLLPDGKTDPSLCYVVDLRSFVGARGGNTSSQAGEFLTKTPLTEAARGWVALELESPDLVVDMTGATPHQAHL